MTDTALAAPRRPTARFMLPRLHAWIALGFGSGLSPLAPGTVGTLWAWLAFLVLNLWLTEAQWAGVIGASLLVGWWACTRTARELRTADPGAIVWDEVVAFWIVLWLITPAGLVGQTVAFVLFRFFDMAKPGPVRWADRRFKSPAGALPGWRAGFGIMIDDLVAALCALLVIALWRAVVSWM